MCSVFFYLLMGLEGLSDWPAQVKGGINFSREMTSGDIQIDAGATGI